MSESTTLDLGPLRPFHAAGVLGLADVHVAVGLCRIAGVPVDTHCALAAALCVRALREGSVCVDLTADPSTWAADDTTDLTEPAGGAARGTSLGTARGPVDDPIGAALTDLDPVAALPWPDPRSWAGALADHPLVTVGPHGGSDRPLRLVGSRLYLQRYWTDEQTVRSEIGVRARLLPIDPDRLARALDRLFPDPGPDRQRLAAATAALRGVTIVAGGPGTGKTTTVARLLAVLHEVRGSELTVGLAAPTGKAAARLQEAVASTVAWFDPVDRARVGDVSASTLHRLLGWRPGTRSRFRHDRGNPLPHDVVVVDETSMVSLSLMARLLEALRPDAQLVLVGDPDQLASVDAGAVLGDLVAAPVPWADPADAERFRVVLTRCCPADVGDRSGEGPGLPNPAVVQLDRTYRFGGAIADLATAVRAGDGPAALAVLAHGSSPVRGAPIGSRAAGASAAVGDSGVELVDVSDPAAAEQAVAQIRAATIGQAEHIAAAARRGDAVAALAALDTFRVLCAHRHGPHGVLQWSARIAEWTRPLAGSMASDARGSGQAGVGLAGVGRADTGGAPQAAPASMLSFAPSGPWWIGRPLLVTANDYGADVYNGDTGVVVADRTGQPRAAFPRGGGPVLLAPARLQHVETLHAMTIHRGQGSQFDSVTVVLPPPESPLLTRELLYTAITRARTHVRLIGTPDAVLAALARPVRRASGLRFGLDDDRTEAG